MKFAANQIDVVAEGGARQIVVAVTDDGPGIEPGDHDRVFDRLYQPARSTGPARAVGSGLGLAIVAELISAMGGTAHAAPGPDGGTRVVVTLPAGSTTSSA